MALSDEAYIAATYDRAKVQALRFVRTAPDHGGLSDFLETEAIQYWNNSTDIQDKIFITHLRWPEKGNILELSRTDVVDAWICAVNLEHHLLSIQLFIERTYRLNSDGTHSDPIVSARFTLLTKLVDKIGHLLLACSDFYSNLADIEKYGKPLAAWYRYNIPANLRTLVAEYIDDSLPLVTWQFQVIRNLQDLVADRSVSLLMMDCAYDMSLRMSDVLRPSHGAWRQRVLKLDQKV